MDVYVDATLAYGWLEELSTTPIAILLMDICPSVANG